MQSAKDRLAIIGKLSQERDDRPSSLAVETWYVQSSAYHMSMVSCKRVRLTRGRLVEEEQQSRSGCELNANGKPLALFHVQCWVVLVSI